MAVQSKTLPANAARRDLKEKAVGFLFISPWFFGLLIFTIFPILFSMFLSMTNWDIITGTSSLKFIGLRNYIEILTDDESFRQSLWVTIKFSLVYLPASQVVALAVAMLLNTKIRYMEFFRTIYFLPSIMPSAAVSLLWVWIFNPQFGVINTLLAKVGIQGPAWLNNPATALYSLVIMGLWSVGSTMIIYLSGLQGVPMHLYEAAKVDGVSPAGSFFNITLPMISPTIFFNFVMGIIGSFQYFTQAYVMTKGGPLNSTLFYNLYLYTKAFKEYKMGYAASLAWIMFVIIMALTMVTFKSSSLWVYYESDVKR